MLPLWMTIDWRRRWGMLVSPPCGTLGADASGVDLTLDDECLLKESKSGRSEPSKGRRKEGSHSANRLGRSS
jgi:hypothetical protein